MRDNPLVSVIINNYNYGRFLRYAVDSALAQSYRNVEIIVVDDGSDDSSRREILRYGDQIRPIFRDNSGQAAAFNAGFLSSFGEIVCFLDSDDAFCRKKIEIIARCFGDFPHAEWCFHRVVEVDDQAWIPNFNRALREPPTVQDAPKIMDLRSVMRRGRFRWAAPPTSGLAFSRDILKQILPMPDDIRITSDNYVKFAACAASPGIWLSAELAIQRIHDSNAYTRRRDFDHIRNKAGIQVLTGYHLRDRFPNLEKHADKLVANGLGDYWRTGGVDSAVYPYVKNYMASSTAATRARIGLHAIYRRLKSSNRIT